ncbi:SMC-Scp complex subunit ScpB [Micromonospora cremea]|uniref:Segregation and condensation protein B n=1 Tax=Micromonospora cremea TaxID=709881 RepID=A0A1N6BCZ5_9ACTN|nr:SMC-Scp complex subunit ScpB [Micromonospora cremea]SIN44211.1 segregation and condensation protein B [Micromonospora cremea]
MSDEERRDSLADQAAAWVPPWDRPRPPTPTVSDSDEEAVAVDDRVAEPIPSGTAEPALPGTAEPALPGTAEPALPGTAEPALPGTAEPALPGTAEPALPGTAEPIPSRPVTSDPIPAEGLGGEPPGPESSKIAEEAGAPGAGAAAGEGVAGDVPPRSVVGRRRVPAAPEPAPELSDAELRGALEAILLVVDEPVSELILAQVLEQPAERVGPMLDEIAAGYTAAGHGFELRRAAGGWRLYTRPEYATYVERFVLDGQSVRLTQAALETLAVVAYKQPVTRSRISAIRGVNCDGVIRTLVTRGLVEECGTEPDSGAFLYRTTTLFLEKLGLNTVDELPPLAPFLPDDVEELADATQ